MNTVQRVLVVLGVAFLSCGSAWGQDVELQPGVMLHFATGQETGHLLGTEDEYAQATTPFDRGWFLKTDSPVSLRQYLDFASGQGLDWTPEEIARWSAVAWWVRGLITPLKLPLPAEVVLAKTTGKEMDDASYTRGHAIFIPAAEAQRARGDLLAHELFHVLTRHNPGLRDALYEVIGFAPCGPVEMPQELAAHQITNPDSPVIRHATHLRMGGQDVQAVAVIYLEPPADLRHRTTGPFFGYLQWRLMLVDPTPGGLTARRDKNGRLLLYRPEDLPEYRAQIGENTYYVIQPEEILADNFVLMLGSQRVSSPAIVAKMRKVLKNWRRSGEPATAPGAAPPEPASQRTSAPAARPAA